MSDKAYSLTNVLVNALLFQMVWFALVLNIFGGLFGLLFVLLMFFHRLMVTNSLKREVIFIVLVCILGFCSDAVMFSMEVYEPIDDRAYYLIPIWLIGLWCGFSMTMHGSLNWLIEKPLLFILLLTITGPISYFLGAELDAINISTEKYPAMLIQWFFISVLMVLIYRYLQKKVD